MQNSILDGVNSLTWETELLKVFKENTGKYLYGKSAKNGCLNN